MVSSTVGPQTPIQEMHQGKAGAIKISDTFKNDGMAIEPHHVTALLAAVPELKKKSLKKKTAKAVIRACASEKTTDNTGGDFVPEGTLFEIAQQISALTGISALFRIRKSVPSFDPHTCG